MLDANLFREYYQLSLEFHDVFLSLSDNLLVGDIIYPLKQRLYAFPRMRYDRQWELINLNEHQRFIQSAKSAAVSVMSPGTS